MKTAKEAYLKHYAKINRNRHEGRKRAARRKGGL